MRYRIDSCRKLATYIYIQKLLLDAIALRYPISLDQRQVLCEEESTLQQQSDRRQQKSKKSIPIKNIIHLWVFYIYSFVWFVNALAQIGGIIHILCVKWLYIYQSLLYVYDSSDLCVVTSLCVYTFFFHSILNWKHKKMLLIIYYLFSLL